MFRRSIILVPAFALMLGCDGTAIAPYSPDPAFARAPAPQQTVDVIDEFGTGAGVGGTATLTRTKDGLRVDIDATGVVVGHAYTFWFVVFDNSKGCGEDGCGLLDLGTRQAQVTLANAGGEVALGVDHRFSAHMDRHDLGGSQLLLGDGKGVDNTYQSELHVILRSHGVARVDAGELADQLSLVGAHCDLPVVGCSDDGVMVFPPVGAPGRS